MEKSERDHFLIQVNEEVVPAVFLYTCKCLPVFIICMARCVCVLDCGLDGPPARPLPPSLLCLWTLSEN